MIENLNVCHNVNTFVLFKGIVPIFFKFCCQLPLLIEDIGKSIWYTTEVCLCKFGYELRSSHMPIRLVQDVVKEYIGVCVLQLGCRLLSFAVSSKNPADSFCLHS